MSESEAEAPPTFEEALAALEARVHQLEAGDTPLEDALRLYEEGVALATRCHAQLEAAEARVVLLTRGESGIEDTPLADGSD